MDTDGQNEKLSGRFTFGNIVAFDLQIHIPTDLWATDPNSSINQQSNSTLKWHHNEHDSVSNHQPHDCLLNRLFGRRSKKTSKLHVTGLCAGNSPVTGEFPAQMTSNAENVSIWWRHHDQWILKAPCGTLSKLNISVGVKCIHCEMSPAPRRCQSTQETCGFVCVSHTTKKRHTYKIFR